MKAKPFLKWAGGKTQLLEQLREYYPSRIKNYYEPFLGSGAVFFDIISRFKVEKAYLSDINPDLIATYQVIQDDVYLLIYALNKLKNKYFNTYDRENFFYQVRDRFNDRLDMEVTRASQFIFLNKTCFNGLHRVNQKGLFNVPWGKYKNPSIFDVNNLTSVASALDGVILDIREVDSLLTYPIDNETFIYLDPPYRPVSDRSFTQYSNRGFDDDYQIRLSILFKTWSDIGAKVMLSNSDTADGFYERYYDGFNIRKVTANRMINSNGSGRGKINEVLITNY